MNIKDLKAKWDKEKSYYRHQELGSGVHSFIRACFESNELFCLNEGSLSGKLELRKKEYIHENKAKEGRKADFVVYINPEIIIPLEAECYGNIQVGIKQLINYQKDFDKHYGVLTDGYTWRFYNNNLYREFNLGQIFDETDLFLEFWKGYIKPEFYYLTFFEPQGQLLLFKEERLSVDENRHIFFNDITKLIGSFNNKLQVEGYFEGLDRKEREKKAVEITYAYVIQFILYKTLVDNDFGNFIQEFKDIVKAIYECLKVKQYGDILGVIEGISNKISQNIYRPFRKEQDFINQVLLKRIRQPKKELHDVAPWLDIFVFIKKYNFANIQNEIFGYIYENYLKELYEDTKKGQYFTDPAIVNFMLLQIGFKPETLRESYQYDKDSISLIDPSCGSGTFLYSAVNEILKAFGNNSEEKSELIETIVNNNIFGLDIAEFPLYLAEMSILMRMLPLIINEKYNNPIDKKIKVFKTKDSISEFMDTAIRNTISDMDIEFKRSNGQMTLFSKKLDLGYMSYVRDEDDLKEMKKSLEEQKHCPRRRFDYVIGNPPYISFKQCSKQNILFFDLMKQKKIRMSDIYGVNLHSTPDRPKKYAPNPNLYAFFIALGLALLKDDGKLCYIIPQTILNAGDLDVLRYHLARFTTIEKIIIFSGKMFIGRGIKQNRPVATSSLIFIVRREPPILRHQVEVIYYKYPNDEIKVCLQNILDGKKIDKKLISQQKLLTNVGNWNFIKKGKRFLDFYENYKRKSEDMSVYYEHNLAQSEFKSFFYFDRGLKFPKAGIKKLSKEENDGFFIETHKKFEFRSFASSDFIDSKLLDFPFGAQGKEVYEQKYKIIWRYINPDKFRFSKDRIMLDYNNVLISSNNKNELLYLLSILNSKITSKIIDVLFRSENEKDLLIGIKSIKEFIRIPVINTDNKLIKSRIISLTGEMLKLEDLQLSSLVDFSDVLRQKFDDAYIEEDTLVLEKDKEKIKLKIKANILLVKKAIEDSFTNSELRRKKINLSGLTSLSIIDFQKQGKIKNYLDDLIFCLYFNINIPRNKFGKPEAINNICQKNKFYSQLILA